jgi:1,4-dihydroxy-2-naphthoate octaprenyltransferase
MKLKALYHLGNWGPLMFWSGSAILLGVAVSIHDLGSAAVSWGLVTLAGAGVVVLQFVAHPVNDILDYSVDARANIEGTGRHKVLHSGLATKSELARLSTALILVVVALMLSVSYFRPIALVFGGVGLFGLWSYNWTPLKLSYYPFSELIVDIPVNVAMVMGISYVAVGEVLWLAFVAGLIQAFMAMSMHMSYFSMDTESDRVGGKTSTIVRYPSYPWCTIYPSAGFAAIAVFLLLGTSPEILAVPIALLVVVTLLGARMDYVRSSYLSDHGHFARKPFFSSWMPALPRSMVSSWESSSHEMRRILVRQTGMTIVNGVAFSLMLVLL